MTSSSSARGLQGPRRLCCSPGEVWRVLVLDRGRYGSDTLSTHALMRGAVLQLHRWGILDRVIASGASPVRSATFHYGQDSLVVPVKPRDGVNALYAPRRTVLDRLLIDAAIESGAHVMFGAYVTDLVRASSSRVTGVVIGDATSPRTVSANLVVGADGWRSTVGDIVGARRYRVGQYGAGVAYARWAGANVEGYQWYFNPGATAGAIPTNDGETVVFAGASASDFHDAARQGVAVAFDRLLAKAAPDLASQVNTARRVSSFYSFPGEAGFFRESVGPGWLLVGDAGYFRDPGTAHGITDALRDAEIAAGAILQGRESAHAEYQRRRDEIASRMFDISDELASFRWSLDRAGLLHEELAREMSHEVAVLSQSPAWVQPASRERQRPSFEPAGVL